MGGWVGGWEDVRWVIRAPKIGMAAFSLREMAIERREPER